MHTMKLLNTLHAQRELGKVIGVGVHIYIYILYIYVFFNSSTGKKKFGSEAAL